MKTIEEINEIAPYHPCEWQQGYGIWQSGYLEGQKNGATEQKAIDHSEEHLNWIIKQHYLWSYEMCHCDNNECCTFKEWIDKAMEE